MTPKQVPPYILVWIVIPRASAAVLPGETSHVPKSTPAPEVKVNCSRAAVKKNLKLDAIEMLNSSITGSSLMFLSSSDKVVVLVFRNKIGKYLKKVIQN